MRRRPDLALPAPADLPTLASRLSVRTSVQRAVDALDEFTLRVLEALTLAATSDGRVRLQAAADLLGELPAADFDRAVADLRDLGLLWGAPNGHLVAGVADSIGAHPAGLGRPADVLLRAVPDVQLAPVLRALGLPPAGQPRAGPFPPPPAGAGSAA